MDKNEFKSIRVVKRSVFYRFAVRQATHYLAHPEQIKSFMGALSNKLKRERVKKALAEVWDMIATYMRLLSCYAKGQYRQVPAASLLKIVACLVYFVMVVDVIPDFIAVFGLIDDVAMIKWTWNSVYKDIQAFKTWEQESVASDIKHEV
jgi:uncharacterized membrane protein YkvA (DUF1232 family)